MNHYSTTAAVIAQIVQVTLVILLASGATAVFLRRRPHWAYALWLVALAKCLTPPLWSSPTGVFSWAVSYKIEQAVPAEAVAESPLRIKPERDVARAPAARDLPTRESQFAAAPPAIAASALSDGASAQATSPISLTTVAGTVWCLGVLIACAVFAVRAFSVRRRLKSSAREPSLELQSLLGELRGRLGVKQQVRLVIASAPWCPALVGAVRPRLVLPAALVDDKPAAELTPIIAHELIHLRRGDHLVALVQLMAQAVWWFHPLVWWMNRQMNRVREMSCDEEVLASLDFDPACYAQTLLDVLRSRRKLRPFDFSPGVRPAQVTAARLQHVMDDRRRFYRRTPRACFAAAVVAALVLLPGAGRALTDEASKSPPAAGRPTANEAADAPEAAHVSGTNRPSGADAVEWTIVDGITGQPIAGAVLTAEHVQKTPQARTELRTTHHTADANGKVRVEITAEEAALPDFGLRTTIEQPGYAPAGNMFSGYQYFRQYGAHGVESPFSKRKLYPGEEVTGTIEGPDGKPLGNVIVTARSKAAVDAGKDATRGRDDADDDQVTTGVFFSASDAPLPLFTRVETDAEGRFRFQKFKGGFSSIAIAPPGLAAMTKSLGTAQGDVGAIRLQRGIGISGRVLDADRKPMSGVWVNLDPAKRASFSDIDADIASRSAATADDGSFTLEPVLPGRFRLTVDDHDRNSEANRSAAAALPAFLEPLVIDIGTDGLAEPVELRALPDHVIRAEVVDSAGRPHAGDEVIVEGMRPMHTIRNNTNFDREPPEQTAKASARFVHVVRSATSDATGKVELHVPRDMERVRVSTVGGYEDKVYRLRRGNDGGQPLQHRLELGKLTEDVNDIHVVNYRAPSLWFKTVDAEGAPVKDATATIEFLTQAGKPAQSEEQIAVAFSPSPGLWHAHEIVPDTPFRLTVTAPGRKTEALTLTMGEGESREISMQLDGSDDGDKAGQTQQGNVELHVFREAEKPDVQLQVLRSGEGVVDGGAAEQRLSEYGTAEFVVDSNWLDAMVEEVQSQGALSFADTRLQSAIVAAKALGYGDSASDTWKKVPYQVGAAQFRDGDNIEIKEVLGAAETFEAGNLYVVKGRYKLGSEKSASLSAFVTVDAAKNKEKYVATMKTQSKIIERGEGEFTLIFYMWQEGYPHISYYPAGGGEGFGGIYFGTGETLLKRGWWEKDDDAASRERREERGAREGSQSRD